MQQQDAMHLLAVSIRDLHVSSIAVTESEMAEHGHQTQWQQPISISNTVLMDLYIITQHAAELQQILPLLGSMMYIHTHSAHSTWIQNQLQQ